MAIPDIISRFFIRKWGKFLHPKRYKLQIPNSKLQSLNPWYKVSWNLVPGILAFEKIGSIYSIFSIRYGI
jgi:hypothetical protein